MSLTPSTMLPLGTTAPDFSLPNIDGQTVSLSDFADSKALLIVFSANHCPYAQHVLPGLIDLDSDYQTQGLSVVLISSNDVESHPDDGPEAMKALAKSKNYPFPYLYDESQEVAKAYTAACTPDLFLFDQNKKLVYRGQFDDSRPGSNLPLTGNIIRKALDQILSGEQVDVQQRPSVGCNIKWKIGNEPEYAK